MPHAHDSHDSHGHHSPDAEHGGGHAEAHSHAHLSEEDWAAMADNTEDFGEVFVGFAMNAIAAINELRMPTYGPVSSVFDVGCGPGVAACAYASAFPDSTVTAIDSSPAMLTRATARAKRLGLSTRVRTQHAELPDGLAGLGRADVVWASMSLHHVGDEVAALRVMASALAPGGLLAIAEFPPDEPHMTMLPSSIDDAFPGLTSRLSDARSRWFAAMRAGLTNSTPSRPLEEMVASAGLHVLRTHTERLHLEAPISQQARRVMMRTLDMAANQMTDYLEAGDLAVLTTLRDPSHPDSLLHRDDMSAKAAQLIVIATAPQ